MKKFLVVGNPIDHSLSPALHNYWIKSNTIDAIYEKQKLNEDELEQLILQVKEKKISVAIFFATLLFVFVIYKTFDKWSDWVAYADTITTAIFFVGMWLMAKRKIENWIFWIIGDIISVPLYLYKGFTFTSFQYLGFTIIAIFGYLTWKKNLNKQIQTV